MKRILFILFVSILAAVQLLADTNEATVKLAIISESPETTAAADVLTAKFSQDNRLQLLERAEIDKVLREQRLSLNNLDRMKLGRLLGADGVLALQFVRAGTNAFLRAQLVAVRPGVLLTSDRFKWPVPDLTTWSEGLLKHLTPLLPKLGVLAQEAIPISVVNLHSAVETTATHELEQQLTFLIIERLTQEKKLFVLERKRMQMLSEEKERLGDEQPFWNGSYLLDGTIDRAGFSPDFMMVNARMIPPRGGEPILIEVRANRTNYAEVVNQLADKVVAALKIKPNPKAWNAEDEAARFFNEAKWDLIWGFYPQAKAADEAAWALGKHDEESMSLRVRTFMPPPDGGVIYFPPRKKPHPEKIDDALHALELYQIFSQNLPPDEPKLDSAWYRLGLDNLCIATRVLQQFNWSPEFYQPFADKLAELRAAARATAALLSRSPSVRDSYYVGNRIVKYDDLYHFMEKESIYGLKVEGGCLWQETPEDTLALYRELMVSPVFRYLHERFWFRDADHSLTRLPSPPRLVAWNNADQKRLPELWQRFVMELKESPDVFLQMEARALQLADTVSLSKMLSMSTDKRTAYQTYDKELTPAFTDFFDAFVTNRIYFKTNNVDVLYLNWGVDDLVELMGGDVVTDTKELLRNRYKTEYSTKLAAKDAEINKLLATRDAQVRAMNLVRENLQAFEKQKAFLKASEPFDPQSFVELFIFGFKDYSKAQAQEIQPLLAEYKKNLSGSRARIGVMQVGQVEANIERIINPAAATPPPPSTQIARIDGSTPHPSNPSAQTGRPLWLQPSGGTPPFGHPGFPPNRHAEPETEPDTPAPEPLVSTNILTIKHFYPLPMDGLPGDKPDGFSFKDHQLVEGKLLLDFRYNAWVYSFDKNGNLQSSADKVFVGMAIFDPESKRWTIAALPESFTEPVSFSSRQSVLWRGDLYSSHTGKIRKYDFQKKIWELAGFSVDGGSFYNLNGRLFIADYNSIQEITGNGRGTKLLASIQRQPPVTSLDSLGALKNLVLFTDAQNFVCAAVHNKVFRWDGTDWKEIGKAAASFPPSVFEDGVLFLTDGWNMRPARISCLDMGSTNVELCLGQPDRQRINAPLPNSNGGAKPLWKLPAELSLPNLSATLWQTDLFLMTDHSEKQDIVAEERGTRPDGTLEVSHIITGEKFLPKDGYDSALFCFSRVRAAAEKIRLKFDDSEGCPPMAGLGSNSQPFIPQIGITKGWMLFTPKFLLCGRERLGDVPGSSEPAGFKPGIWVVPLDAIMPEITSLKQTQSVQKRQ
jgi:TolB-like protein